jgi:hypothetical protein
MVIVEENHAYDGTHGLIGNAKAPYFNSLATTYVSATNYFSVVHGSPSDYMALIAGNTLGSISKPSPLPTLADELAGAGVSWKGYFESMPSACDLSGTNDLYGYASDHNPFLYYTFSRQPSQCQNLVPYTPAGLSTDLNGSSSPSFVFLVPNQCNDMHTECPAGTNTQISNGDAWLKSNLPAILNSAWFKQNGVVIITMDEGYNSDSTGWNGSTGGHIPTVIVSASNAIATSHSYSTGGNLYGILHGIEEAYGVGLLGASADPKNGDLKSAF